MALPPRSRRSPAVAARGGKPAVPKVASAPADDVIIDVGEPNAVAAETVAESAAVETSADSSRSSSRKSARGRATKSSAKKVVTPRRAELPEEVAARRARIRLVLIIAGSVAGAIILFVVLATVVFKTDKTKLQGENDYKLASNRYDAAVQEIGHRNPEKAEAALKELDDIIAGSAVLNRGNGFTPESPEPIDQFNSNRAKELVERRRKLGELKLAQLYKEIRVERNYLELNNQMAALGRPDVKLDELTKAVSDFIANPIDPAAGAGPSESDLAPFKGKIDDARAHLISIEKRRQSMRREEVEDPIKLARVEAEKLIEDERFGTALTQLEKQKSDFPKAAEGMAQIEARIRQAAGMRWKNAEQLVEGLQQQIDLPATTPSEIVTLHAKIRSIINPVVEKFGVDEYVTKAKAILEKLPAAP